MYKLVLIAALALPLAGCDWFAPKVKITEPQQVYELVNSLTYIKSVKGPCYGVTTTARMNTGGNLAYNNHIVYVPCNEVGL
jgi:hypothetical protein